MEKAEALEQERDIGTVEKEMMKLNMLLYKKRGLHHELEQSNSLMESDFIGSLKVRPLYCLSVSDGANKPSYQIQTHLLFSSFPQSLRSTRLDVHPEFLLHSKLINFVCH